MAKHSEGLGAISGLILKHYMTFPETPKELEFKLLDMMTKWAHLKKEDVVLTLKLGDAEPVELAVKVNIAK